MKLEHRIEIAAPPEQVFDLLADHARLPEWISTLQSSTLAPEDLRVGAEFHQEHVEAGRKVEFEGKLSAVDRGRCLGWDLENKDAVVRTTFQLEPTAAGTALVQTTEVDLKNMMLRMMAGAFQGKVEERIAHDFETLKSLCEA